LKFRSFTESNEYCRHLLYHLWNLNEYLKTFLIFDFFLLASQQWQVVRMRPKPTQRDTFSSWISIQKWNTCVINTSGGTQPLNHRLNMLLNISIKILTYFLTLQESFGSDLCQHRLSFSNRLCRQNFVDYFYCNSFNTSHSSWNWSNLNFLPVLWSYASFWSKPKHTKDINTLLCSVTQISITIVLIC